MLPQRMRPSKSRHGELTHSLKTLPHIWPYQWVVKPLRCSKLCLVWSQLSRNHPVPTVPATLATPHEGWGVSVNCHSVGRKAALWFHLGPPLSLVHSGLDFLFREKSQPSSRNMRVCTGRFQLCHISQRRRTKRCLVSGAGPQIWASILVLP